MSSSNSKLPRHLASQTHELEKTWRKIKGENHCLVVSSSHKQREGRTKNLLKPRPLIWTTMKLGRKTSSSTSYDLTYSYLLFAISTSSAYQNNYQTVVKNRTNDDIGHEIIIQHFLKTEKMRSITASQHIMKKKNVNLI